MSVEILLAQWRVVDQQASDAERRILDATFEYLRGAGPPPSDRDRVLAAELRQHARALFIRALAQVDAAAEAARRGALPPSGAEPSADSRT